MPIFYFAFHSKPQATDKLHIIIHSHDKNPRGSADQQRDPSVDDYGLTVESECGLTGILLKPDKDAIEEGDFEGMGLKQFREKFSDIEIIYFFMPPVLRVSMPVAVAEEGIIPKDRVCEICKDNLKANVREANTVLQKDEEQQELARQEVKKKKKEEEQEG
jgi:hypothetical protein